MLYSLFQQFLYFLCYIHNFSMGNEFHTTLSILRDLSKIQFLTDVHCFHLKIIIIIILFFLFTFTLHKYHIYFILEHHLWYVLVAMEALTI